MNAAAVPPLRLTPFHMPGAWHDWIMLAPLANEYLCLKKTAAPQCVCVSLSLKVPGKLSDSKDATHTHNAMLIQLGNVLYLKQCLDLHAVKIHKVLGRRRHMGSTGCPREANITTSSEEEARFGTA